MTADTVPEILALREATPHEAKLVAHATKLAAPYFNGEKSRNGDDESLLGSEMSRVLWQYGFIPAYNALNAIEEDRAELLNALESYKALLDVVEEKDRTQLPPALLEQLSAEFDALLPTEPDLAEQRLDERTISEITEFRVVMFTDEGKHAGRPHVRVYLRTGHISISLDDPPCILTKSGGHVGEASALKTIAKHRDMLLKRWDETRPDTQRLPKRS